MSRRVSDSTIGGFTCRIEKEHDASRSTNVDTTIDRKRTMYGNLLSSIFLALSLCVIFDEYKRKELLAEPPVDILVTQGACVVLGFTAWWSNNHAISFLADLIGTLGSIITAHVQQYPIPWEPLTLVPHYAWILFLFSANRSTTVTHKLSIGGISLLAMEWLGYFNHRQGIDMVLTLALLYGMYAAFHICYLHPNADNILMIGSRTALALLFAVRVSQQMYLLRLDPSYAPEAGLEFVKTTGLAAVLLMAVGAFGQTKNLQVKVERQEDRLYMAGLALEASETAVAITTTGHSIVWANPAMERLLHRGRKPSESIIDAVDLSRDDAVRLQEAFSSEGRHEGEVQVGSSTMYFEISRFTPPKMHVYEMENNVGEDETSTSSGCSTTSSKCDLCTRHVVVFKDITSQKARERAEQAAEREAMSTKAMQESMEALTHELRTPLQGIMGVASLVVTDDRLPVDAVQNLELIMASSSLLLVLINNLLDVRKCNVQMMEDFDLGPISCSKSIDDAIGFCQPLAKISRVDLNSSIGNETMVLSNNLRLQQVLINLISNAIKYSAGHKRFINVSTEVKPQTELRKDLGLALAIADSDDYEKEIASASPYQKMLVISVADSGGGIPKGQEKNLFRKFSMLNNTTGTRHGVGQPTGSGLGLQLCQKFVRKMKGRLWVENNDIGGSTFSVCLPYLGQDSTRSNCDSAPKMPVRVLTEAEELASIPDCSVLLVDDTLINRQVFSRILQKLDLRKTRVVESGHEALDLLSREAFDVVITDIKMPEMDGIQLSDAIHSNYSLVKTPIVIGLTADTGQRIEQLCMMSGMLHVLHKPITPPEMRKFFSTRLVQLMDDRNRSPHKFELHCQKDCDSFSSIGQTISSEHSGLRW